MNDLLVLHISDKTKTAEFKFIEGNKVIEIYV